MQCAAAHLWAQGWMSVIQKPNTIVFQLLYKWKQLKKTIFFTLHHELKISWAIQTLHCLNCKDSKEDTFFHFEDGNGIISKKIIWLPGINSQNNFGCREASELHCYKNFVIMSYKKNSENKYYYYYYYTTTTAFTLYLDSTFWLLRPRWCTRWNSPQGEELFEVGCREGHT